ncbi:unnamed protein product [Caenorhabditis brenneri]
MIICNILVSCGILAIALTSLFCEFVDCDGPSKKDTSIHSSTTVNNLKTSKNSPNQCEKRIVGYFNGWESREISYNMISKLTHVIYATIALDEEGTVSFESVKSRRCFYDAQNNVKHSNTGVKFMISIGGTSYSEYFSAVARDKRENFINSTISFIKTNQVDGVDIYWSEPNKDGSDKENYVTLIRELRQKLTELQESQNRTSPYLLTVLTPAYGWTLEDGTDIEALSEYVDFFNIASDDYTEAWSPTLGHYTKPHAPLYAGFGEKFKQNVDWTMRYYTCKTRKPSMLNMGLPFFGRYWKNVLDPINPSDEMWRRVGTVNGSAEKAMLLWKNVKKYGWNLRNMKWDDKTKSSYIWDPVEKSFLGIDDERSLIEKMNYVKKNNLGGVMIWTVEMDDYSGSLLNAVSSVNLCEGQKHNKDEVVYKCS